MDKLVLFDIDGTLVAKSYAHREAFEKVIFAVYGVDISDDETIYAGRTDQQVVFESLRKKGIKDNFIKARLKEFVVECENEFLKRIDGDNVVLFDGIKELLEELKKRKVLLGLVTGNLEKIAFGKLRKAGIADYFSVGGFGSDHIDRAELVKIAVKRAIEKFNFVPDHNVFFFGDTAFDVRAGKEANVVAVGVTTGLDDEKKLKGAGADFVIFDLKDKKKVFEILKIYK